MPGIHIGDGFKVRILREKKKLLAKLTLHLFQNLPDISGESLTADFVECTFLGYAPIYPISWGTPFLRPDRKAEIDTCPLRFSCTGGVPSQIAFGWYCTDENGYFALGAYLTPSGPSFGGLPSTYSFVIRFLEDRMRFGPPFP
jgi:hypothetical protein